MIIESTEKSRQPIWGKLDHRLRPVSPSLQLTPFDPSQEDDDSNPPPAAPAAQQWPRVFPGL